MQMVKKITLGVVALWFTLLFFMPKAELYYTLEKTLAKQDIKLNEKHIDEGLFSLTVTDITVFVKGIALANIKELHFFTLLFYTTLDLKDLVVDETLHTKIPAKTKHLHLNHQILNPTQLTLDANGTFGIIEGNIDLMERSIHIDFVKAKDIKMIQHYLKSGEKGWIYEKSF